MAKAAANGSDSTASSPAQVGPERYFQDQLEQGRFLIQRSRSSGAYVFYPRIIAPVTGADDLEWVEPCGRGTVYSTTMVLPGKGGGEAYNIALVDLEEGPRMLTRVVDIAPEAVTIGMKVRARIGKIEGKIEGKAVVLFVPAEAK